MAKRHYKKSTGGKKRGPKKGSHQSAAHRKAISEGLKRYYKSGHRSRGGRRVKRGERIKRQTARHKKRMGRILKRHGRKRAHGGGRPKGRKNKYLTHSPRTGKSYF